MSLADLQPLSDKILVKLIPHTEQQRIKLVTAIGEFGQKADQNRAVVVRCGPGKRVRDGEKGMDKAWAKDGRPRPMQVKVGDVVWFGRFTDKSGEFMTGDEEYAVIQEGDVIGIEADSSVC